MAGESAKGAREHFGQGRLALDPDRSVFINCPFDAEYGPTFDAIVFSVACCGFIPLPKFEERKNQLQADWRGRAPWADIVVAALETAPRL